MNLSDFIIAAAPFGGPIALTRDDSKMAQRVPGKPIIFVFSCSGKKLSSFKVFFLLSIYDFNELDLL